MYKYAGKPAKNKSLAVACNIEAARTASDTSFRFTDNRQKTILQKKQIDSLTNRQKNKIPIQKKENKTGLPDQLKSGIENLSGYSMDDVKVHYNSPKPSLLQAHAYAHGTQIHLSPGQEKHLPQEALHVAQQKQGRVKPTMQMKGKINVNDDKDLEKEADIMGTKALGSSAGKANMQLENAAGSIDKAFQFVKLNSAMRSNIADWAGEEYAQEVLAWFEKASQLTKEDVQTATGSKFKIYKDVILDNADAGQVTPDIFHSKVAAAASSSSSSAAETDPLAEVRKKLKSANIHVDLSIDEQKNILDLTKKDGWEVAIRTVYVAHMHHLETERLKSERIAKCAAAKAAGDPTFNANPLAMAIWNLSYGIASGTGNQNTTLGGEYNDAIIIAAANLWNVTNNVAAPAGSVSVANMHVPGAPHFIEDKSTRIHNPDPTRGRQADFIATWGGLLINVHVNSSTHH